MTFSEVYDRIIAYWPENISISDGGPIDIGGNYEATPHTAPSGGQGWLFPALNMASDEVEDRIDHANDTWGSLMAWTFFQVFHAEAIKLRVTGAETLLTRAVERGVIEKKYYENLHGEDWSQELLAYRRI